MPLESYANEMYEPITIGRISCIAKLYPETLPFPPLIALFKNSLSLLNLFSLFSGYFLIVLFLVFAGLK
jgi:hypothetical protein